MTKWGLVAVTAASGMLAACTSDRVIFVTNTSLGINFDAAPTTVSVAFDRTEGYSSPSYRSGTLPPVLGRIQTNGQIIQPRIKQLYATGAAAVIAAGKGDEEEPRELTNRTGRLAFVGTTTTVGLKAAFAQAMPESFVFGIKRKEFSYIPLGCQLGTGETVCSADDPDLYPSVIASLDHGTTVGGGATTEFNHSQFIATGAAATVLARNQDIQGLFEQEAKQGIKGAQDAVEQDERVRAVLALVAPAGVLDDGKRDTLVQAATNRSCEVSAGIANAPDELTFKSLLRVSQPNAKCLFEAMGS
jgi:hypothetical protein